MIEKFIKKILHPPLEQQSTKRLVNERINLETRYGIKDQENGGRWGEYMPREEVQKYNEIISHLEKRNIPRPAPINPDESFAKDQ